MDTPGTATPTSHATISTCSESLSTTSNATRAGPQRLRKTNAGGPVPASRTLPTVMAGAAPAIREELDQTRSTGPRTGSAGDGPILFHGPDPQCSLYIPKRRSRPFSRRARLSMPTAP